MAVIVVAVVVRVVAAVVVIGPSPASRAKILSPHICSETKTRTHSEAAPKTPLF